MIIGLNFMKSFGIKLLLPFAAILSLAVSCKDDDESSTTPYLSGNGITFSFKAYVRMKDQITFKPYGAYHPESGEQVYWEKVKNAAKAEIALRRVLKDEGATAFTTNFDDLGDADIDRAVHLYLRSRGNRILRLLHLGGRNRS